MFGLKSRLAAMKAAPTDVNALLEQIDDRREVIATLRAERDQISRSPRPTSEIIEMLDSHFDDLATAGVDALRLGRLTRRDQPIMLELPHHVDRSAGYVDSSPATRALLGLIIATSRPAIREIIASQISDLTRGRPGMSDDELSTRLAEIDAEILNAELGEERAIRSLESAGVSVLRRADASPLAVLASDAALPSM